MSSSRCSRGPDVPRYLPEPAIAPPRAVAFQSNLVEPEIVLAAQTKEGIYYTYWNDSIPGEPNGGWSRWIDGGNPTGVNPESNWNGSMPMVGWIDQDDNNRVNGFFAFTDNSNNAMLGAPYWHPRTTGFHFDLHSPQPFTAFTPVTGVSWVRNTPHEGINFYGSNLAQSTHGTAVYEYWWDGNNWGRTDLESPDPDIDRLELGPQSAVVTQEGNIHEAFVFAISEERDTPVDVRLQLLYHHNTDAPNWEWLDLGVPEGTVRKMRPPLVFQHIDQQSGKTHVNVFVVCGYNPDTWKLWERHWTGEDWDDWEDWKEWGIPPGPTIDSNTLASGIIKGFTLNSAVVWDNEGTKRINLFGYTDTFFSSSIQGYKEGGHLINFWWDGARWQWGETVPTPDREEFAVDPRKGTIPFRTVSAVVVDSANRDRVSVFGVSDGVSDVSGDIWERYWDTAEGQAWQWKRH